MTKKLTAAALLTALHMGIASYAAAADSGFYFGAGAGRTHFDSDIDINLLGDDGPLLFPSVDIDRNDISFEGLVGYRFLPFLAVEAAYMDLGELSLTANSLQPAPGISPIFLGVDLRTRGVAGSVLGILPLSDRWELFGRAGILFADDEGTVRLSADDFSDSFSDSGDSQRAILGIGATLNSRSNWSVRLEYRFLREIEDEEINIDQVSLGIIYRL
jgi:opacity protein-like surface antigen